MFNFLHLDDFLTYHNIAFSFRWFFLFGQLQIVHFYKQGSYLYQIHPILRDEECSGSIQHLEDHMPAACRIHKCFACNFPQDLLNFSIIGCAVDELPFLKEIHFWRNTYSSWWIARQWLHLQEPRIYMLKSCHIWNQNLAWRKSDIGCVYGMHYQQGQRVVHFQHFQEVWRVLRQSNSIHKSRIFQRGEFFEDRQSYSWSIWTRFKN